MPIREYFCKICNKPFEFITYKLKDEFIHPSNCPNCFKENCFERLISTPSCYFKGMLETHGGQSWGDFPPIPPGDDRRCKPGGFKYKRII